MMHLITTFGYVGHLRPAPGTWGSLAALPFAWAFHTLGGFTALFIATVFVFFIGWWATAIDTKGKGDHDPSEIVIDEVAGQWIALWPISLMETLVGGPLPGTLMAGLIAFALFRFLDITKPGPIGWADRRGDALGVMLDDVIAGLLSACILGVFLVSLTLAAVKGFAV